MTTPAMSENPASEISGAAVVTTAPHTKEHWGQFGIKQLVAVAGIIAATIVAYEVGRHNGEQPQPLPMATAMAPSTEVIDQKDSEIDSLKRDKAELAIKLQQAQADLASERAKENSLKRPPDHKRLKPAPSDNVSATSASGPALAAGPGAHDISQTTTTYQLGQPPRHLTEEDRQAIQGTLAELPKDAKVGLGAPIGDSEAIAYANEIYHFMQALGFKNFNINSLTGSAVAYSMIALPSPPRLSIMKGPDGTYQILVHQQR